MELHSSSQVLALKSNYVCCATIADALRCFGGPAWMHERIRAELEKQRAKHSGAIWPIKDVTQTSAPKDTLEVKLNILCRNPLCTWQSNNQFDIT